MPEKPWPDLWEEQLVRQLGLPQPTDLFVKKIGGGLTVDLAHDGRGNLQIVRGRSEIIQALYLRTIAQKGDWIFDTEYGLPWIIHPRMDQGWPEFLGQTKPDLEYVKITILHEWSKDERFVTAPRLDVRWGDPKRRAITITGEITTRLGRYNLPAGAVEITVPIP